MLTHEGFEMRYGNCFNTVIVYAITLIALAGCGGSSEDAQAGNGGSVGIGGAATGGLAAATGGKASTGGVMALTGGSTASGGSRASGGVVSTGGVVTTGGAAAAGGIAATGGAKATGGTLATGGAQATGGSKSSGDAGSNPEVEAMCREVCTLLDNRKPPLACVPADCVATCNTTYVQLDGANKTCSDAYRALYECGLSQPASSWECFTVTAGNVDIDIPIPPRSAATCGSEYQALYSIILLNLNTCGAALSY